MNDATLTLGWDIGGAHLKAALLDADGRARRVFQRPCPLWRGLEPLHEGVAAVLDELQDLRLRHAVTMTGELVDFFPCREEGVAMLARLLSARLAAPRFYAGRSGFVAANAVAQHASDIASANWHASAVFLAARSNNGLLVDIGSTTSDLIVLHNGRPAVRGYSDVERLRFDELLYTGVVRTPVMALAQQLPLAGEWQRLAAEHFATMADVYRLTGELPAEDDLAETADGAGKTPQESARRLARMCGCDLSYMPMHQWRQLASSLRERQLQLLQSAAERAFSRALLDEAAPLIGAGAGRFLVSELARRLQRPYCDAAAWIEAEAAIARSASVCLPAYAVAWLAREAPA